VGNSNRSQVGEGRQRHVGSEMHPAGSEHDCRGNADHPATHALAFRGW
jgi:hypothetical protein